MAESMSSLEALIKAAQFLEENGTGSTGAEVDIETTSCRKRTSRNRMKKPSTYSRTTHNLLEKNRRAQLRDCLEVLRQHVPFPDKLTTLALLQSARKYIETLQQKEREETQLKGDLQKKQTVLLSRLAELGAGGSILPPESPPSSSPASSSQQAGQMVPQESSPSSLPSISKQLVRTTEEDENMVIDVMHDSEDDTSSTTSGSDGGTTSTSHKYDL